MVGEPKEPDISGGAPPELEQIDQADARVAETRAVRREFARPLPDGYEDIIGNFRANDEPVAYSKWIYVEEWEKTYGLNQEISIEGSDFFDLGGGGGTDNPKLVASACGAKRYFSVDIFYEHATQQEWARGLWKEDLAAKRPRGCIGPVAVSHAKDEVFKDGPPPEGFELIRTEKSEFDGHMTQWFRKQGKGETIETARGGIDPNNLDRDIPCVYIDSDMLDCVARINDEQRGKKLFCCLV